MIANRGELEGTEFESEPIRLMEVYTYCLLALSFVLFVIEENIIDRRPIVDTKDIKHDEEKKTAEEDKLHKHVESNAEEVDDLEEVRYVQLYDMNSITALILSIFAILSPFMVFGLGGLLGVILGVIALYQVRQSRKTFDNDMNHTAKVLAVIGLVISGASMVISILFITAVAYRFHSFSYAPQLYMRPGMTYFHRFW